MAAARIAQALQFGRLANIDALAPAYVSIARGGLQLHLAGFARGERALFAVEFYRLFIANKAQGVVFVVGIDGRNQHPKRGALAHL